MSKRREEQYVLSLVREDRDLLVLLLLSAMALPAYTAGPSPMFDRLQGIARQLGPKPKAKA